MFLVIMFRVYIYLLSFFSVFCEETLNSSTTSSSIKRVVPGLWNFFEVPLLPPLQGKHQSTAPMLCSTRWEIIASSAQSSWFQENQGMES